MLVRIEERCFPPEVRYDPLVLEALLASPRAAVLLAESGGAAVGYAAGEVEGPRGHVVSIAVLPEWRGKGIGRALLLELEREMAKMGAEEAVLEVSVENERALRLYRGAGYEVVAVLPGYYGSSDAYLMVKRLGPRSSLKAPRAPRR